MTDARTSRIPTFRAWYDALRPRLETQVVNDAVRPWAIGVSVFVVLDVLVTIGASFWRYADAVAAWPATQAALADWDRTAAALTGQDRIGSVDWGLSAPHLDLDLGAATAQIATASSAFAVLLAAATMLAARGHRLLAVAAALAPAVSVAVMGGPLARVAPMIPVHSLPGPPQEVGAAWPEAVHGVFLEVLLAMAKSGTPVWWNAAIAVAVAAIAVAAVVLVLRRAPVLGVTPNRARADIVGGLVAWGAAIVVSNEPRDLGVVETSFLVATFVVALALGAAGAVSRARTALVLSVGVLAVDALVHAAFDRDGGAPGGWGVGSGGAQVSATTGSAIAIAAAPLAGWAVAAAWAALPIHEPRRKAAAVTT